MQGASEQEAGHLSPVASPPASPRSVIGRHAPERPAARGATADKAELANGLAAPAHSRDGGVHAHDVLPTEPPCTCVGLLFCFTTFCS